MQKIPARLYLIGIVLSGLILASNVSAEEIVGRVATLDASGSIIGFETGYSIAGSSASGDVKTATWDANGGPYYRIGPWPVGDTITLTLDPAEIPSGYLCSWKTFGEKGSDPEEGEGCIITDTILLGENHWNFYFSPIVGPVGENIVGRVWIGGTATTVSITGNGKSAIWGTNKDPDLKPFYSIGRWPATTEVELTVNPPAGYACDSWWSSHCLTVNIDGTCKDWADATTGTGCTATDLVYSGPTSPNWENHWHFYLKALPPVLAQCEDGIDNDGDGEIDFGKDPGCTDAKDDDETDPVVPPPPPPPPDGEPKPPSPIQTTIEIPTVSTYNTAEGFVERISSFICYFIWALSVLMIVIAAFYFVTAAGDFSRIQLGKRIILYALIGLLICLLGKGIAYFIKFLIG